MPSQRDEDKWILDFFGAKKGRFLDIGAFDGKDKSNTWCLAEKGWGGVCVEPSPGPFKVLQQNYEHRNDVLLVLGAVAPEGTGIVEIQLTDDLVSTIDKKTYGIWKDSVSSKYRRAFVPSMSYQQLIARFGQDFQFVNIDAEGVSWSIFQDFIKWDNGTARMVCIEMDSYKEKIVQLAATKNLGVLHETAENLILAR